MLVFLDQTTKAVVVQKIHVGGSYPIPGMGGMIDFTLVQNTGTAFGLFPNSNLFFIILSMTIIGFLGYLAFSEKHRGLAPFVFILGGAIGNLSDRIRWGYVVDFIDVHFWPVFNVADSCITAGIAWFLLSSLMSKQWRPEGNSHQR